jgi:hypothetical protein
MTSFAWRYLCALASAVYVFSIGFIFARDRELIVRMCEHFGVGGVPAPMLPHVDASDSVVGGEPIQILEPAAVEGNISVLELMIIASLVRTLRPKRLFEIGTFDGRTTLNLAANSLPESIVFTLDLPRESRNSTVLPLSPGDLKCFAERATACRFAGTEYEKRIVRLWGDSASFDFSPFLASTDLVFVDGSHSYEYVLKDSGTALTLLHNHRGLILWHDYGQSFWPGVTRALNELFAQGGVYAGLRHIEGTALACLLVGVQAGTTPVG